MQHGFTPAPGMMLIDRDPIDPMADDGDQVVAATVRVIANPPIGIVAAFAEGERVLVRTVTGHHVPLLGADAYVVPIKDVLGRVFADGPDDGAGE